MDKRSFVESCKAICAANRDVFVNALGNEGCRAEGCPFYILENDGGYYPYCQLRALLKRLDGVDFDAD